MEFACARASRRIWEGGGQQLGSEGGARGGIVLCVVVWCGVVCV